MLLRLIGGASSTVIPKKKAAQNFRNWFKTRGSTSVIGYPGRGGEVRGWSVMV